MENTIQKKKTGNVAEKESLEKDIPGPKAARPNSIIQISAIISVVVITAFIAVFFATNDSRNQK